MRTLYLWIAAVVILVGGSIRWYLKFHSRELINTHLEELAVFIHAESEGNHTNIVYDDHPIFVTNPFYHGVYFITNTYSTNVYTTNIYVR